MNPLNCPAGRKAGSPLPSWYRTLRGAIESNLDAFPPGIDIPFLAAWIERESDGRHDLTSSLDEVGYFQLHPAEIVDMVGKENLAAATAAIQSNPQLSLRWGGALLYHYDQKMAPFRIPRGTTLYHGLLKTFHWSPPRATQWLRAVSQSLGRPPDNFDEFLQTAAMLKQGDHGDLPPLPSCSAWQLLQRRNAFVIPGVDSSIIGRIGEGALWLLANQSVYNAAMVSSTLGSATVSDEGFVSPIDGGVVFSGWGRPRPERGGWHQGIDIGAAVGTPVRAVADGSVTQSREETYAGRYLTVRHSGGWTSRYMHLGDRRVGVGDAVRQGQVIATVGQTSSPHLHFDLHLRDDLLPAYAARYGMPKTGWGAKRAFGTAVPAEPVIPVAGYSQRTVADAKTQGIPLFTPSSFPWAKAFVGVSAAALLAVLGVHVYRGGGIVPS